MVGAQNFDSRSGNINPGAIVREVGGIAVFVGGPDVQAVLPASQVIATAGVVVSNRHNYHHVTGQHGVGGVSDQAGGTPGTVDGSYVVTLVDHRGHVVHRLGDIIHTDQAAEDAGPACPQAHNLDAAGSVAGSSIVPAAGDAGDAPVGIVVGDGRNRP